MAAQAQWTILFNQERAFRYLDMPEEAAALRPRIAELEATMADLTVRLRRP